MQLDKRILDYICPLCKNPLIVINNNIIANSNNMNLKCMNCNLEYPEFDRTYNFVVNKDNHPFEEKLYYNEFYSSKIRLSSKKVLNLAEMRRRWNNPLYPELQIILQKLKPLTGKIVLCLGNGSSEKELYLAALGANVIFSDISINGILRVKNLYRPFSLEGLVEFHAIDAYHLPFNNSTVDIIYGYEFVHHIDKISDFLPEVYRVMKPGGITTFFECGYSPIWHMLKMTIFKPLMRLSHKLQPRSEIDIRGSYSGGYKEEHLKRIIYGYGFQDIYCHRTTFFQYIFIRGIGSLFGWQLPKIIYRITGIVGKFLDKELTERFSLLRRSRIEMVWGFRKPTC
jgi:ubiquinone/menaquinone biosynthesis C-methylase UbiE